MRNSRGQVLLIPFIVSIMIALSGCAQEEASGGVTDVTGALFLSENETAGAAVTEEQGGTAAQETSTEQGSKNGHGSAESAAEVSEITEAPATGAEERARTLTEEECRGVESFLNEEGSCGFLLSKYEKPQDIDAEQAFSTAAGLFETDISDEEREAYLEETGEEDAPDLMRLSAQQISDNLQYRAGISPEDLTDPFDWVYLEEYDAYYLPREDGKTDFSGFEVTDAAVQGDYYRVHYRYRREHPEADGWYDPVYEAILKKNGDGYRFCANRRWLEKDLLLRPFCSVELEPYGEVYLCAYEPDLTRPEVADVTFELVRDGEVIARLPGVNDTNLRAGLQFEDVVAVDTGDYDGDGIKEIMAICRYKILRASRRGDDRREAGKADAPKLREDGLEARIYRFMEDEDAEPDKETREEAIEGPAEGSTEGSTEESGAAPDEEPGEVSDVEISEEPDEGATDGPGEAADEEPDVGATDASGQAADVEPGEEPGGEPVAKRELKLDADLSDGINRDVKALSITGIAQYIKTGKDRGPFASREEAYAGEVEAAAEMGYDRFALIFVNEDREPELLEIGSTPDKGAKILFYDNDELQETKISSTFSYLNKENLLYSKYGTQNVVNEALYVYRGGGFNVYQNGTYGAMDAAETAYSEDGKPQYLYTWEGSYVSEAGYKDALEFAYNRQKAVDASKIETLSAEEMLKELKKKR